LRDVLSFILAGGRGQRLDPLTRDRAKPAVPFGGFYRIIDFTLSNCINSGLRRIYVLTQYKSFSLGTTFGFSGFSSKPLIRCFESTSITPKSVDVSFGIFTQATVTSALFST